VIERTAHLKPLGPWKTFQYFASGAPQISPLFNGGVKLWPADAGSVLHPASDRTIEIQKMKASILFMILRPLLYYKDKLFFCFKKG
jgi:hypothetical protein